MIEKEEGMDRMMIDGIEKMTIHTRTDRVDGMRYLSPQEIFDALPPETRDRIHLVDFKAVLGVILVMFAEVQHRQVDRSMSKHAEEIAAVKEEEEEEKEEA